MGFVNARECASARDYVLRQFGAAGLMIGLPHTISCFFELVSENGQRDGQTVVASDRKYFELLICNHFRSTNSWNSEEKKKKKKKTLIYYNSIPVDHQAKRSYERLTLDHGSPTVGTVSHSKTSTPDVMPPIEATTTSRSTTRWRAFVMPINQIREFLMTAPTLRPPADGSMPENCARVLEMQLKGPLGTNQSPILKIYTNDCERIRKNALNKRQWTWYAVFSYILFMTANTFPSFSDTYAYARNHTSVIHTSQKWSEIRFIFRSSSKSMNI